MSYLPKSISEHIECLARLTGAPESFVIQVKELFSRKGIALDEEAEPYLKALEEAFRREECIRFGARRAQQNISTLQENFQKIGRAYVEQLSQLRKIKVSLKVPARRAGDRGKGVTSTRITIKGGERTLVTRTEREELQMVPGPQELQ